MIRSSAAVTGVLVLVALAGTGTGAAGAAATSARQARQLPVTAYVATTSPDSVVPVRLATGKILPPIPVHGPTLSIAVTRDGRTVVVVNYTGSNRSNVVLIHTATGKAFKTVRFAGFPIVPVVLSPDSKTAYIATSLGPDTVMSLHLRTGRLGRRIHVRRDPEAMAITPDGRTLYVASDTSGTVTPIRTATWTALRPIRAGQQPGAVAVTPDGKTAYVKSETTGVMTPIRTATNTALRPVRIGNPGSYPDPQAIAIPPRGKTAYVLGGGHVTPIATATRRARTPIRIDPGAGSLVMSPDGARLYAVDYLSGIITPVSTATGKALHEIHLRTLIGDVAVTPDSKTVYAGLKGGTLIPFATATGKRGKAIQLPPQQLIATLVIAP
jgi:YVTN family beta-propeller protein